MTRLTNKTIWVTGASSGVGLELVILLAKARNYIFVSARGEGEVNRLQSVYPDNICVLPMDVTDAESVADAERQLLEKTDHLDLLITCVGICEHDGDLTLAKAMFERITRINYLGIVETVRIALPFLRRSNNHPQIVAISDLAVIVPFPGAAAFGASKAALEYFLQSLRLDMQQERIDVTVVRPGFVTTSLNEKNSFETPYSMSNDITARRILGAISKRKLLVDFPKKLSLPLKLMRLILPVWMKMVAPRLKRPGLL